MPGLSQGGAIAPPVATPLKLYIVKLQSDIADSGLNYALRAKVSWDFDVFLPKRSQKMLWCDNAIVPIVPVVHLNREYIQYN